MIFDGRRFLDCVALFGLRRPIPHSGDYRMRGGAFVYGRYVVREQICWLVFDKSAATHAIVT